MLPKPIMKTSLLTQMKNNRELPLYGFKQSMGVVQQTIAHKLAGDGNTNKSLDDVLAFKRRIEATYAANTLAVINGRIRFEHEDLYIELKKLSGRMSSYAYRFVVIYWVSYLDEFEQACMEFLQQKQKDIANIGELFNPESYEVFREYYEVSATSSIFFEKLGKHPETRRIFDLLGFEAVPPDDPAYVKAYRCQKDRTRLSKVVKISELLKKIAAQEI